VFLGDTYNLSILEKRIPYDTCDISTFRKDESHVFYVFSCYGNVGIALYVRSVLPRSAWANYMEVSRDCQPKPNGAERCYRVPKRIYYSHKIFREAGL